MHELLTAEAALALVTLTALEIVLGIDNIVFISILTGKLPAHQQEYARKLGLGLALGMRVVLLLSIAWVMSLTEPLFEILGNQISGRDLILATGGLFLIWKSVREIHDRLEGPPAQGHRVKESVTFAGVLVEIALLDIVFSLDSVITAVGMSDQIPIMIAAVILAILFMILSAGVIGAFVERHPTVKMLALSFLLLIGVMLLAESLDQHIPKGYIYFAMAFSVLVEMLNLRQKSASEAVQLHTSRPTLPVGSVPPDSNEDRRA